MNTLLMMAATAFLAVPERELPRLTVPKVDLGSAPAIERVDSLFEAGDFPLNEIGCVNWPDVSPDKPDVRFRIAHSGDEIYIKYYVSEGAIRAVYDSDGNRPWEESCVEFFFQPGTDATFYNLEMSCIGYGITHGRPPGHRHGTPIPPEDLAKVRRLPSMPRETFGIREGEHSWTLTLAIPVEIYSMSPVPPLSGRTARANFYKCGDKLPRPHFISWSPIDTPKPSFHEPGFFGELFFE
jgi:hypothetical protein